MDSSGKRTNVEGQRPPQAPLLQVPPATGDPVPPAVHGTRGVEVVGEGRRLRQVAGNGLD